MCSGNCVLPLPPLALRGRSRAMEYQIVFLLALLLAAVGYLAWRS